MNDRQLSIIGFATVLAVAIAAALVSRWQRAKVASLTEVVDCLTSTRVLRAIAVALWALLGWHFLAR
ncbi:DUF6186 family protein [Nocardia sp. alder85J]|uniref:DUF6186 family protein n=1 Tax=Nocardia sp. alder85J TaxID=2862949 RepID=UPI001CD61D47|nr:DUF6186 family protein [Nocardia sp. alder85J]MCX4095001.1 DUF6186 family protein [Nocardia sp. alder85J]